MPTELETVKLEARRVAIDTYNTYIANYRKNTITEINRIVRNRRLMSYYNYQKTINNIINNYYAHVNTVKNELTRKLQHIDNMTLPKKEEVVVNKPRTKSIFPPIRRLDFLPHFWSIFRSGGTRSQQQT